MDIDSDCGKAQLVETGNEGGGAKYKYDVRFFHWIIPGSFDKVTGRGREIATAQHSRQRNKKRQSNSLPSTRKGEGGEGIQLPSISLAFPEGTDGFWARSDLS
jgi:hypothetical protein